MNWDVITLIGVVIIALVVGAAFSGVFTRFARGRITVYEHEAGLRYKKGRLVDVVGPGLYATWPAPVEITRLDLREASTPISGQEILTADQLSLRVSVVVAYRIADPRAYASSAAMPITQLYHIVQTELRGRVAARKLDEVLADRGGLVAGMAEAVHAEAAALGYKVSSVKLLDLTIAGPAKQAYADLWKAQKEGLAALERARGEQSALRALANAARMLKGNPELMNLRVLQTLAAAPGKTPPTVVLGGASGLLPVASAPDSNGAGEESA